MSVMNATVLDRLIEGCARRTVLRRFGHDVLTVWDQELQGA